MGPRPFEPRQCHLALNADGTQVATKADSVQLRDARTGRPLPVDFGTQGLSQPGSFFDALHFSPNGRWLWEVRNGSLHRRDALTGRPEGNPIQRLQPWRQPQLDADGRHLVVFLTQGVRVVRLDDGGVSAVGNPTGAEDPTGVVALDPDARQLATIDATGAIQFWDMSPGKPVPPRIVPPSGATAIEFSPDGRRVAILGRDGSVRLQPVTAPPMAGIKEWPLATAIGFDARGRLLMHFASNGSIQWWNPSKRAADSDAWQIPERGPLIGAALSADGNLAATVAGSAPGQATIRLWNTASGTAAGAPIPWRNAGPIALSPDARTLAGVSGEDGSIHLWDVATGKPGAVLSLPQPMEVSWGGIRFSPDGRFVATRSGFRTVHLWDLTTGKLAGDPAQAFYVALADDWKRGLTEGDLIDLADPHHPKPVPHPGNAGNHPAARSGLALSPDGRLRIALVNGRTLRLWDVTTEHSVGQEIVLRGTAPEAWFTPDSRLVLVAQQEGGAADVTGPRASLRLWETSTGLPCGNPIPTGSILDAPQFDRELRFLAQTDLATAARVWRLPSRDPTLAEMERQSWLAAGSRLDDAGNPVVLDAGALKSLETTQDAVPR